MLAISAEAEARLRAALSHLAPHEQTVLAEIPLDWALGVVREKSRHDGFLGARVALAQVADRIEAADATVAPAYARLLLLTAIAQVADAAPQVSRAPARLAHRRIRL